jgi:hypothetical protein
MTGVIGESASKKTNPKTVCFLTCAQGKKGVDINKGNCLRALWQNWPESQDVGHVGHEVSNTSAHPPSHKDTAG